MLLRNVCLKHRGQFVEQWFETNPKITDFWSVLLPDFSPLEKVRALLISTCDPCSCFHSYIQLTWRILVLFLKNCFLHNSHKITVAAQRVNTGTLPIDCWDVTDRFCICIGRCGLQVTAGRALYPSDICSAFYVAQFFWPIVHGCFQFMIPVQFRLFYSFLIIFFTWYSKHFACFHGMEINTSRYFYPNANVICPFLWWAKKKFSRMITKCA